VVGVIEAHRASTWLLRKDEMHAFPRWLCPANQTCRIRR
jgi:hypothetical protein